MTDELTIAKDQFLLDCMHELTKVKNEQSTTRDTLSKVRTEFADTKTNLATTSADLDIATPSVKFGRSLQTRRLIWQRRTQTWITYIKRSAILDIGVLLNTLKRSTNYNRLQ